MRVLYLSLFLIVSDQITKLLVKGFSIPFLGIKLDGMSYGESINVIGEFFKITFVENPGMAFGIDVGIEFKLALSLFSLVAAVAILYYLYKVREDKLIVRVALALIFAGAVGNLIDRSFYGVFYGYAPLFYGKVVDFFNVDFWDFTIFGRTYERWPIFNIADSCVTLGVILIVFFHREPTVVKDNSDEDSVVEVSDSEIHEVKSSVNMSDETNGDTPAASEGLEESNGETDIRKEV